MPSSLLLLPLVSALIAFPASQPATNEISIRYGFDSSVITQHEPVILTFEVHNGSQQPVTLTLGSQNDEFFELVVTRPDGEAVKRRSFSGPEIVTFGTGKVSIGAGSDYRLELLLNEWFDFPMKGTYRVTARLTSGIESDAGVFYSPAEGGTFRIIDRQPAKLEKLCAELEAQVRSARNVEVAQEPAKRLSYIDDPIAVPYLAGLLSTSTLTYDKAISGLSRIANDEAVEALLSALNAAGDIAETASRALGSIERKIIDPRLRARVDREIDRFRDEARGNAIRIRLRTWTTVTHRPRLARYKTLRNYKTA